MTVVEKKAMTIPEYAAVVRRGGCHNFQNKSLRDQVAAFIVAGGGTTSKRSIRNQRLHPEYVLDYVGTYETGFGNQDYMTPWKALYQLTAAKE